VGTLIKRISKKKRGKQQRQQQRSSHPITENNCHRVYQILEEIYINAHHQS